MSLLEMLRPTQASVVAGVDLRDVNDAIDRGILPEGFTFQKQGRRLSATACMFITFYHQSAKQLTSEERLFAIREVSGRVASRSIETLQASSTEDWIVRDEFLHIDLERFAVGTFERWRRYRDALGLVESSPHVLSGTLVIRGTRIPVYDVAASATAGHPAERIMNAYPGLKISDIGLAGLYAKANPRQGRPRATPMLKPENLISEVRRPRRRKSGESLHR